MKIIQRFFHDESNTQLTLFQDKGKFGIRGVLLGKYIDRTIETKEESWYVWHDYIDYIKC